MTTITISDYQCCKNDLTQEEIMIGMVMERVDSINKLIDSMIEKGLLLDSESGEIYLNHKFRTKLKKIAVDSGDAKFEERCRTLAKQLMDIFPKGSKMNDNGTKSSYYWKCNTNEVANKLAVFFKEYGDYDDERIIEATKKYVNDNYPHNQKNMRILKYFIYKMEGEAGAIDRKSDLATMLTAIENGEEDYNSDWTMNLINE